MIHYHGTPITPTHVAVAILSKRHACVSFAHPDQTALAFEVCQSVILDNGAFSIWKRGGDLDVKGYVAWVNEYRRHPAFDWALIPDVIDGDESDNDALIAEYRELGGDIRNDVPVWHLHESLDRLKRLCHSYQRVALGSSGVYSEPGSETWWHRMGEAMMEACDEHGRPKCKLHGLRMLDPTIFSQLPLSSADSTNVAQNIGIDKKWNGGYAPLSKQDRAIVLAGRIEAHASAARWTQSYGTQKNLELVG